MTFAEKLVFLMNLTSTSNKQLAIAANVDPSFISLLRTARRGVPRNLSHIRTMANYFGKKCEGNYQRIALSEAMGRKHLQLQMNTEQLSEILFDWLTDNRDQVGQFLNTFEQFPLMDGESVAFAPEAGASQKSVNPNSFAFYGNEGKRGAVNTFIDECLSSRVKGTVLFCSDESLEWVIEDAAFLTHLRERMMLLLQSGFSSKRIAPPLYTTEQAFDSLSQLLPLYLTGQVESYYYPRLRDEVYHRTLIVLPDVAALVSTSVGNQRQSRYTVFTRDKHFISALAGEFNDYMEKCRPMMTAYSNAGSADDILRCISQFETDKGERIQQSTSLSSITTPPELLRQVMEGATEEEKVVEAMLRAQETFKQSLESYGVTDIHSLATIERVCAGKVDVAVSNLRNDCSVKYTKKTYALHLQGILELLKKYKNYNAVLLPESADNHALLVKEGRQALLLRPGTPLMVFEVSQPYIAEACRAYLASRTVANLSPTMQRNEVISRLKQMIAALKR